jgi:hypothetical protein
VTLPVPVAVTGALTVNRVGAVTCWFEMLTLASVTEMPWTSPTDAIENGVD